MEEITTGFVKEWIEKHHLTRNSYESVLSDALTNNGHYYIDNPYLRVWIKSNTVEFRELLPHELNENQQIVLDYLKNTFVKSDNAPIVNFSAFGWKHFGAELPTDVEEAYKQMNGPQDLQVLQAFAEWALEQEED